MNNKIDLDECLLAYLGPESNTPPILQEYLYSGKKYLLLLGFETWYFDKLYHYAYIVCRYTPKQETYYLCPTFTELKHRVWVYNMLDLKHCITMIFNENVLQISYEEGQVIMFDKPCPVRGQTIADRYHGELYGQTTQFIIVGIAIEKICNV